ncbi:FAD-dependent oxidoreductase [Pseudomonas sp. dw_358]|uniref:NAD(P)/FAD-dependent oxidoreductase n=1 Tax=Pseudomonas sp. dw_358 TaxID=2720083 RepID=UPI001BD2C410|nr:FAD-dependent oxidoreductase [Pseudomonas sp. dw_358]
MNAANAPMVIIGAGHSGGRAAMTLRAEGYEGPLLLIGDEVHPPYERPPLSKGILQGATDLAGCTFCDAAQLAEAGIEHLVGNPVARLAAQDHQLVLQDGRALLYSKLLLATGGRARRLPMAPAALANVLYLRTHDEALALRDQLQPGARLLVVGGGFIGLEVAATARLLGCAVTLVEAGPRLAGRALPAQISDRLLALHRERGVDVRLDVGLERLLGSPQVDAVELTDGQRIACDLVVVGIGMQPNTELAAAAGLEVGQGIRVDDQLRASAPDIYAAGDVCEFRLHPAGEYQRQETWRNAEAQGRHAALNMLGAGLPFAVIPGFWSDQYDWSLQTTGVLAGSLHTVSRSTAGDGLLMFYLDAEQRLQGACGWGPGNSVAKDIKLCERLITAGPVLRTDALADPGQPLKQWLRG